jgi:hypothetical protein
MQVSATATGDSIHAQALKPTQAWAWRTVLLDYFSTNRVDSQWFLYNGPYGSGPRNCARPDHVTVSGGFLRLKMAYRTSGNCGAGWYTAGMMVDDFAGGVDQRVTLRFRVVQKGTSGHFIIPMRWPTNSSWPAGGEEDYCETDDLNGCSTFLHYSSENRQVDKRHTVNLRDWHYFKFERRNNVVKVFIDDMNSPKWTYNGSSATLPNTFKRVVLQQECHASGCPSDRTGTEEIQIGWIRIENPA